MMQHSNAWLARVWYDDDEAKQDTESRRKGKKAKKTGNDYPPRASL